LSLSISKIISQILDGSIVKFKDRQSAGELLCSILRDKYNKILNNEVLIIGIPRGGIIIGDVIAKKFGYQLDIVIPRRMVDPHNRELSIGGIMNDRTVYLNTILIKDLQITDEYLNLEIERQLREIKKREFLLGKQINPEKIKEKNIILVDDGVATGATLIVTCRWIRKYKPRNLTILIPICPKPVFQLLKREADCIESILTPSIRNFTTVEFFFQNFNQLEFAILHNILKKYRL
jgi:putative phosphoribosyl transferase